MANSPYFRWLHRRPNERHDHYHERMTVLVVVIFALLCVLAGLALSYWQDTHYKQPKVCDMRGAAKYQADR